MSRDVLSRGCEASVSFEDICLDLPSGEKILEGVSGEFKAGRMCDLEA